MFSEVYFITIHNNKYSVPVFHTHVLLQAIHRLLIQHQLSNMDEVYQALLKLLQQGLTCKSFTERQLIIKIIKLLIHLGGKLDNLLASVFMGLYSEGDTEIQSLIIEYFHSQGLEDPQKYFSRELTIAISGDSLSNLINRSSEWIDSWAEDYLLREKGVKTAKKSSSKANATGKRSQSLPVYSTIDVINYFVHMEHQKELARYDSERLLLVVTCFFPGASQPRLLPRPPSLKRSSHVMPLSRCQSWSITDDLQG